MKHYSMVGARFSEARAAGEIEHAERTAFRNSPGFLNFDIYLQVWPNRASMARSIRMQEKREHQNLDWSAVVPLGLGEGY
jgi:hypothetical protein